MTDRPIRVALWDAVNEYAQSCGGDADRISVRRMSAVVAVERAVDSEVETLRARAAELERALRDAMELSDEWWAYAETYYRAKWDYEGRAKELRALIGGDHE